MKKRGILFLVGGLAILSLLLASCSSTAEDSDSAASEDSDSAATDGPQYGGTVTFLRSWPEDPSGFGGPDLPAGWVVAEVVHPYNERLLIGDVEKYGPRGTNEFAFRIWSYQPAKFLKGQLAESWEVSSDPMGVQFNIRKGVMWTGNANMGMDPRELTAYDVRDSLQRMVEVPATQARFSFVESITATDNYTVFVEFGTWKADWAYLLGYGPFPTIVSNETIEAGPADWRNAVGTGPFILTDYVEGSSITYKRNPDYWGTATIDGKEYTDIPFIDTLIFPVMVDESTKVAAIRTGKIDVYPNIPLRYEDSLKTSTPELETGLYLTGRTPTILFNVRDNETFQNKELRRALMIALDLPAIGKSLFGKAEQNSMPFSPALPENTPMEELPDSARMLFDYDPDLAREMLADAGYPNGLKIELEIGGGAEEADIASLVSSYWGEIGVELIVEVLDSAANSASVMQRLYEDAYLSTALSTNNPLASLNFLANSEYERCNFDDAYALAQYKLADSETDPAKSTQIMKALGVYLLDQVPGIPLGNEYGMLAWWPWIKNYQGELESGFLNYGYVLSTMWLDQSLKTELGH